MPIRARTLRRPASKARSRLAMARSGVTSSAPRVPASSAASSMASHGTTAVAPTASAMAAAWTSRMSAASTTMSVWPRRPASVSAAWTAPGRQDRRDRQAPRPTAGASLTTSTSMPRSAALHGLRRRGDPGPRRGPSAPAAAVHVASSDALPRARRLAEHRGGSPAEVGHERACEAQRARAAGRTAEQRRAAPELDRRSMTMRSRSGSMAGLVTWAKDWRRWSATGGPGAPGRRRRVVAHAPQRLVRLEGHRLDVEPLALGVEPAR